MKLIVDFSIMISPKLSSTKGIFTLERSLTSDTDIGQGSAVPPWILCKLLSFLFMWTLKDLKLHSIVLLVLNFYPDLNVKALSHGQTLLLQRYSTLQGLMSFSFNNPRTQEINRKFVICDLSWLDPQNSSHDQDRPKGRNNQWFAYYTGYHDDLAHQPIFHPSIFHPKRCQTAQVQDALYE